MIDDVLMPIHGGTDSGPTPRYDFSTNANSLGPDPYALAAVQAADPSRYPDPLYTSLHTTLARFHQVPPEHVAVGGGTSELIHRLTRWRYLRGPMLILPPTFSEYARAAQPAELPLLRVESEGPGVVVLDPGYPTKLRQDFPVFPQRRPELYQGLLKSPTSK